MSGTGASTGGLLFGASNGLRVDPRSATFTRTAGKEKQRDYIWDQLKTGQLRRSVLSRSMTDVGTVSKTVQDFGVSAATPEAMKTVFDYIFDSNGIAFTYDNYAAWMRLATGRGQVADVRFLVHEMAEIKELDSTGVDFMGKSKKAGTVGTPKHDRWMKDTFDPAYLAAHTKALRVEYQFLADKLALVTGESQRVPVEVVAAIDPASAEGRTYMQTAAGTPVSQHGDFAAWQARAAEPVSISRDMANRLGVDVRLTLGELVAAIRTAPLDTTLGSPR